MEMRLEEIRSLQAAVSRLEDLAGTYHDEIEHAHREQDQMGYSFRLRNLSQDQFESAMDACSKRAVQAQAQINKAEEDIRTRRREIAELAGDLSDVDLAFL
jgi:uncharacterized coiled-coil DUF342 family protein